MYSKELTLDKTVTEDNAFSIIKDLIDNNKLILFIKGTPLMPMCGFSARVVEIFEKMGTDYKTLNVIANPIIRESMKKYSNWPTIPQIYYNQEFVGGCDIITDMYMSGELQAFLESK